MLKLAFMKPARRIGQLERPEEITSLFEIGSDSHNLMNEIFHADHSVFAQVRFDQTVVRQGDTLFVDLAVSALVHEFAHGFHGWVAICDEGFDYFEHFDRGFCQFDEDSVVDLEKAEQLEDFAGFGGDFVDTAEFSINLISLLEIMAFEDRGTRERGERIGGWL